ncbi:hypothetical protein MTQ13_03225 [Streptomyces sp. XM4011]|uniref:hypothetical protein n=1 Tax=Streptomyces sp. XM4011 TaxID=2929780 RepID=UPI001FF8A2DB|nr:hypothetical protein [Streptomyces sp. XM4011]MCK1813293.1 hypothetical protein [Streptomyces sp. XM4011]
MAEQKYREINVFTYHCYRCGGHWEPREDMSGAIKDREWHRTQQHGGLIADDSIEQTTEQREVEETETSGSDLFLWGIGAFFLLGALQQCSSAGAG